ncbi:hypothetical protein FQZ97_789820 [compost metagenome]
MHPVQVELIHQALEDAGVEVRAGASANDGIAFAPARAVQQDHAETGAQQRLDVAVEVGPAAGTGARAVEHDHGFTALAAVVVMDVQRQLAFLDADELAGGCFGNGSHVGLSGRVQDCANWRAPRAPKPAIHSGIGR